MEGEKELLKLLQGRINDQIFNIEANKILFHARFDLPFGHKSKKNGKQPFVITPKNGGRPFATLPTRPDIKQAEDFFMLQLRSIANRMPSFKCIGSDVQLWGIFHFYFKNYYVKKKKQINKKINDLSNLYELPQDALQKAGIIENDSQIASHDLSRRLPGSKDEIEIFLIEHHEALL